MKRSSVTAKPGSAKRKPVLVLTLGTAIAFIAGGALAYGWLNWQQRPLMSAANVPVGAEVIPQSAVVALSFSTDERQWQRLRTFGTPDSQARFDAQLAAWRDRLLTANGLDYRRDIAPWVGETVTLGFLSSTAADADPDAAESAATPTASPVLLVLPIADPMQAQQVLGARAEAQGPLSEREYNGVTIREATGDNPMAIALLNNSLLVMAQDGQVVEQAIDTHSGGESIAQTPGYRQSLSLITVQEQPFLQAYVNLPATRNAEEEATAALPLSGDSFPESRGLAATVTVESEGMRLQTVTWLDPDSDARLETDNRAGKMTGLLPVNTLAMLSGSNLQRTWNSYGEQSQISPSSPLHPDNVQRGVQNTLGLSLDQDLLPWMNGEFALALATAQPGDAAGGLNILFLAEAGDRDAADNAMTQLESALTNRHQYTVGEQEIEGQTVKTLAAPSGALTVRQGWLDRNLAFWSFSAPGAEAVLPTTENQSFATANSLFTAVTDQSPSNNTGYFFVNTERLFNAQSAFPVPVLPPSISSYLEAIRAIGVTARAETDRAMLYDISVVLKRGNNPGSLPPPGADPAVDAPLDLPAE
jgi:hypothetical protein